VTILPNTQKQNDETTLADVIAGIQESVSNAVDVCVLSENI